MLTPLSAVTAAGPATQILAGLAMRGAAARETDIYDRLARHQGPKL